jgi:hypothetical protein
MKPFEFCCAIEQIDPGQFFQGFSNLQKEWILEWKKYPKLFQKYVRVSDNE